ncbi:hypothetical protein EVAR_25724_1, partial [Eumeta japonica]
MESLEAPPHRVGPHRPMSKRPQKPLHKLCRRQADVDV